MNLKLAKSRDPIPAAPQLLQWVVPIAAELRVLTPDVGVQREQVGNSGTNLITKT